MARPIVLPNTREEQTAGVKSAIFKGTNISRKKTSESQATACSNVGDSEITARIAAGFANWGDSDETRPKCALWHGSWFFQEPLDAEQG